jgi:ABC-type multidrug transport system fused ATPase/permease subunit
VVHYARGDVVPKEASHASTPENKPTADWPARGAIEFKNVSMAYRPGLPNVLHGISLHIKPGEKIGVVGRTGAGKSSLTLCLLRIVEYLGQIVVDECVSPPYIHPRWLTTLQCGYWEDWYIIAHACEQ